MERFSGTLAVVTGSSVGIGAAVAKSLLERGLIVAGLARREDKLKQFKDELDELGFKDKFFPIKCDVTVEQDVIRAFDEITNKIGKITILINNAGVCSHVPIHDAKSEDIDSVFNTNVKGIILCARQAIKIMRKNSTEGHIVNLCSVAGAPGWIYQVPIGLYSSSKHAVRIISNGLRREMILEKTKIKVSNISPGFAETEMTAGFIPEGPLKRVDVQDIANVVISVLDTPPGVVIPEVTVLPLHEMV
ncbi:farnesol dehydrogenase-like [Planococcus citri]|uniref:farnesol dehydrogenase-like n=1 Tax=Planococcus citri TaxID=170843 RepID=UPI0031F84A74